MSLLLENCKILDEKGNLIITNIFIGAGKIKYIGKNNKKKKNNENKKNTPKIDKIVDCKGMVVLPGLIDAHVHFREPGMTHKEDFLTGSMAAAAGGITTILDMPNTIPPTTTIKLLEEKRSLAKKSIVNYGFHFGAAADNIKEIKNVKNIASVKLFMNASTGKLMIDDDKIIEEIFKKAKIVSVHAEGKMVEKAVRFAKKYHTKLYLCHITSKDELEYIDKNRNNKEKNIFVEVTPHHLFLTLKDDKDAFTKMKPELKSEEDQQYLLEAVKNGIVDTICTDHAPHTKEEKLSFNFPHGVPGCETMLPLLLDAVNRGIIEIGNVIELCCENPAKIFGIKNKGKIKEGYDADITVVDMNLVKKVENNKLFTKCRWSPFNGKTLKGWPVMTIVNGNIVFEDGRINNIKAKEVEYLG